MLLYSSLANIILASVLLFFNWRKNANSIYLFLMLLFIAIHGVLQSSIMNHGPIELIVIFFNNFSPLYFLIGPMLYFYVRGTLRDNSRLSKKDLWHFIPAFIVMFNVAPYWITSLEHKYNIGISILESNNTVKSFNGNWLIPSSLNFIIRGALLVSYEIATIILLFQPITKNTRVILIPREQQRIIYAWLKILVFCMLLAIIGYYMSALILILMKTTDYGIGHTLFITFNYICFVPLLIIPLSLLTFPQILYGMPILKKVHDNRADEHSLHVHQDTLSTNDILIDVLEEETTISDTQIEENLQESANAIMHYLKNEKPYLDKDFSMDKLAQALQLPRHHIYFCMNRVLKIKFPELRKQLRIQHAKELLEQGKNKTLSIEGIGLQSGFPSRSNFFTAFKSEVGCTPSEYLEKISGN